MWLMVQRVLSILRLEKSCGLHSAFFIVALKPNDVPVTCSIYVEDVLLPQLFQVLGSCEDKKGA